MRLLSSLKMGSIKAKRSYWYAAILALAVIVWIGSGQLPGQGPAAKATDDGITGEAKAETLAPIYKVQVQTLQASPVVEEIHLLGRTEAKREVTLRAETAGSIAEVVAKKGQTVKKGDVKTTGGINYVKPKRWFVSGKSSSMRQRSFQKRTSAPRPSWPKPVLC